MSAPYFAWVSSGEPDHGLGRDTVSSVCACCGIEIEIGVAIKAIESPTTSNHADFFRFNSAHVCDGCAWLFTSGKGKPGNYIATPRGIEYAVISLESVVEYKRPWLVILRELADMPGDTQVTGVMTTDVKPRLWPRSRLATVDSFGLYLHVGDYDVSEYRAFSLRACIDLIQFMTEPLTAGFTKASIYHGLLRDYARSSRNLSKTIEWEATLVQHRQKAHFMPALIAAGVTKEE